MHGIAVGISTRLQPIAHVARVQHDTEQVGGDESHLPRPHADDANYNAVQRSDDPAVPQSLADEHGGNDGQNAGDVVKT